MTDTLTEYDTERKDGKLSITFDVHDAGLTGTSPKGADIEMDGTAQVVLSRAEAIRLYEAIGRYMSVDLQVGKSYSLFFDDKSTGGKREPAKIMAIGEKFIEINSPLGKGELIARESIIRALPINEKKED